MVGRPYESPPLSSLRPTSFYRSARSGFMEGPYWMFKYLDFQQVFEFTGSLLEVYWNSLEDMKIQLFEIPARPFHEGY